MLNNSILPLSFYSVLRCTVEAQSIAETFTVIALLVLSTTSTTVFRSSGRNVLSGTKVWNCGVACSGAVL